MKRDEIELYVKEQIATILCISIDDITLEDSLMEDLDISSLEIMELIGNIEKKTGVLFSENDTRSIIYVKDLIDYVEQHQ